MPTKKNKSHIVTPLDKGKYSATVGHSEYRVIRDTPTMILWWIVDTGKHIGHKFADYYPCIPFGQRQIEKTARRLDKTIHGDIEDRSKIFLLQFIAWRARLVVDLKTPRGKFVRNVIIRHHKPTTPPEENVLNETGTDHFYKEESGRSLPIDK